MAHIWTLDDEEVWAACPLPASCYYFGGDHLLPIDAEDAANDALAVLRRLEGEVGERWVFISAPDAGVRINSDPLPVCIRVLNDRDELRFPGLGHRRFYFSTEKLAAVEPFPGYEHTIYCARCQNAIELGTPAVKCPNPKCGVWHHQGATPCWTYSTVCAQCDQPTGLEAGFQWTPEDL